MMLIACAMLVTAVAVTGIAIAHTKRWGTNLAFTRVSDYAANPNAAIARGKVRSVLPACRNAREVQVYRVDTPSDVRLRTTFSGASGFWKAKIARPANGTKLYAIVEAKALPPNNHNHYCAEDFSPVRTYPYP